MEKKDFQEKLVYYMKAVEIDLTEQQVEQFYQYMILLLEWNEKMNLTAITEPIEIMIKHFVDCSTIIKEIEENKKVADIGTGAGFPGIPIKILKPEIEITLVDSLKKRINFLENVIQELGLTKTNLIHSRVEDLAHDKRYREKFDIIVSRAVAPLNVLLEYTLAFLKVGGITICMKGSNVEEEIVKAKRAFKLLECEVIEKKEIVLPEINIPRNILKIEKKKVTPKTYPRKAGRPSKEPIA